MGEKDLTEKVLMSYKDVFADIVNVLIFKGKSIIFPKDLTDEEPHSYYYDNKEHIHEQTQDVVKAWTSGHIQIACIGHENQTQTDTDMVFRVFGYEGARYRAQLNQNNSDRYPVLTLILYYGTEHRWEKNLTLHERLMIDSSLKPYIPDYKINVFEIAYLTPETVNLFHSDFRIVADFFVQTRTSKKYIPSSTEIKHVEETLRLLAAITDDERFELSYVDFEKGAPKNMCEVIDNYINIGVQQGLEQGLEQGLMQSVKALMENLHMTPAQAMTTLNISEENKIKLKRMLV